MPLPDYFTRQEGVKKRSQRQEKRVAVKLNGKPQKGSGAVSFHKGDVRTAELLLECKTTQNASLSIKQEWLEKVSKESVAYNKVPALSIEFQNIAKLVEKDWVMVPAKFLAGLIEFYKDNGGE